MLKKWLIFLQTCKETKDIGALQKGADFVRAFTLGFDVDVSYISSIICKNGKLPPKIKHLKTSIV